MQLSITLYAVQSGGVWLGALYMPLGVYAMLVMFFMKLTFGSNNFVYVACMDIK
jgi:hypothetical protein